MSRVEVGLETAPIVVGFDGSAGARAAAGWALAAAALRSAPVQLVYAVDPSVSTGSAFAMPWGYPCDAERLRAQAVLAEAVTAARVVRPAVAVLPLVRTGQPVAVLCRAAETARLTVLGHRGVFASSTAVAVAAHARGPVAVIGDQEPDPGAPVAVGIDDGRSGDLVMGLAMEEAALRGVGVLAVLAHDQMPARTRVRDTTPADRTRCTAGHRLDAVVARWSDKYPTVPLTGWLVPGDARRALVAATRAAQLIVVGCRGRGGFAGLALGSVSQHLLQRAECPVVVVPGDDQGFRADPGGGER